MHIYWYVYYKANIWWNAILTYLKYFLNCSQPYLFGIKVVKIRIISIGNTYVRSSNIWSTYIKYTYVVSVAIIKHLKIYL